MRAARVFVPFLLLALCAPAWSESLWSPDFKGYISGGRGLAVGDSLIVQIDASSSLSFSSSSNDSKNLTLEFSGGEAGNLFAFLPQVRTGGSQSAAGKDSLSLKTQLPVVVTAVNKDGSAQVQGSRAITVQGKSESVTVTGAVSPGLLDQRGIISFSSLSNARLSYTTFLASSRDVLTTADLQTMLAPATAGGAGGTTAPAAAGGAAGSTAPAAAGGAAAPAGAAGNTGAAAGQASAPAAGTLAIPDARKKELLLLYLNRLVDVIFAQ
jgi:hypothetical protein